MRIGKTSSGIVLALAATALSAQTTDRVESKTAGIAAVKPQGWQTAVQPAEAVQGTARLKDQDLLNAMPKAGAIRVIVLTRYPEPHAESLNPSIQVILRPLAEMHGKSAVEILQGLVDPMKKAFPDFHYLSEIKATTIGGLPGASMKSAYTLFAEDGGKYPLLTRLYVVPRGALMFLIGTAGPHAGPDVSEPAFDAFMNSLVIQP